MFIRFENEIDQHGDTISLELCSKMRVDHRHLREFPEHRLWTNAHLPAPPIPSTAPLFFLFLILILTLFF